MPRTFPRFRPFVPPRPRRHRSPARFHRHSRLDRFHRRNRDCPARPDNTGCRFHQRNRRTRPAFGRRRRPDRNKPPARFHPYSRRGRLHRHSRPDRSRPYSTDTRFRPCNSMNRNFRRRRTRTAPDPLSRRTDPPRTPRCPDSYRLRRPVRRRKNPRFHWPRRRIRIPSCRPDRIRLLPPLFATGTTLRPNWRSNRTNPFSAKRRLFPLFSPAAVPVQPTRVVQPQRRRIPTCTACRNIRGRDRPTVAAAECPRLSDRAKLPAFLPAAWPKRTPKPTFDPFVCG